MTIRKGEPWGAAAELPDGAVICASDAEVAEAVGPPDGVGHRPPVVVGLTGGDLFRTLGGRPGPPRWLTGDAASFPIDALVVDLDGESRVAVAHVVARDRGWWAGPTLVVMNAAFVGEWYLGPRGHPNDGRADVTEGSLGWTQRRRARSRMPAGAHVPHPALAESRVSTLERPFAEPRRIWLDGIERGRVRALGVRVVPDAFRAIV
jgi:hypothetical protein